MSSLVSNPFDMYEIQQVMQDYLPQYQMEFLANVIMNPKLHLYPDADIGSLYCPRKAAQKGILPAVKWYYNNELKELDDVDTMKGMFSDAIFFGHVDVLTWLSRNGCPVYKTVWETLIEKRYHSIFKMIVPHSIQFNEHMCRYAAVNGDIEILKYLHEHGCPWDKYTCSAASSNGHLNCLKYAHEEGCPWDENTCSKACDSEYEHIDCLVYAHINGCPWDKYTCKYAARNDYEVSLKYALLNDCPFDDSIF